VPGVHMYDVFCELQNACTFLACPYNPSEVVCGILI
jgi:hypothetical protein